MYKHIVLILLCFTSLFCLEADHVIFNKIVIQPSDAELISIYNPTDNHINLSNYYLSDAEFSTINTNYYNLPTGSNYWSGFNNDFIAKFPDNITIESHESIVIALDDENSFSSYYGNYYSDVEIFYLQTDMLDAFDGQSTIGMSAELSNSYEVLILFKWDGDSNSLVQDIDYFYWGNPQGLPLHGINKTGISTYKNDTPFDIQEENILDNHNSGEAYVRKTDIEDGESNPVDNPSFFGNGITGHDETSEVFKDSWEVIVQAGCTEPADPLYNPDAIINDGSCTYYSISDVMHNCSFEEDDIVSCSGKYDLGAAVASECPLYEETIAVSGTLIDYFDVTGYGGPHSFTIEDDNCNTIDFAIWPTSIDITQIPHLNALTLEENFLSGRYEIEIIGELGVNCDDDEQLDIGTDWQITVEYESDISVVAYDPEQLGCTDPNNLNYNSNAIKDNGSCVSSTIEEIITSESLNDLPCPIAIMGLVVGYGDYREPNNGPQVIELLDIASFDRLAKIDLVIWDWDVLLDDPEIASMFDSGNLTEYSIVVKGTPNIYNGSYQFEVASPYDIYIIDEFNGNGLYVKENIIKPSIDPAPFVLIPTLGERLDYSFSFPSNSKVVVRVFDFNGNIITTLFENYYENSGSIYRMEDQSDWDGRTHLGQIVPPGTYLMHIETTNLFSGESAQDVAPIVLGVY